MLKNNLASQAFFVALALVSVILTTNLLAEVQQFERLINNQAENLEALKADCEKDLPRNRECVLVYEYVPVSRD
jgi:hypothetical protein